MLKSRGFLFLTLSLLLSIVTQAHASLKSINEFTRDMNQYPGFFSFYVDDSSGKLYLEVEKLDQAFLLQQSLPMGLGSNDIGLDRGQLGDTRLVKFEKMGNKLMLRQINTYYRANTDNKAELQSVKEAFASSILFGFEVKAKTAKRFLVDYTPYLLSDVHGVSRTLAARNQGSFSLDLSRSAIYMPRSKSFAKNTELEAVLTFSGSKPGEFVRQVSADPYSISLNMHHSLIELPDDNFKPRVFHPQSGYWSIEHKDYAAPLSESMYVRYIPRHRLSKKDPQAAISEPVEPIVYYLDPGVPDPVKTALLEGALWWNDAFAQAGYKNAFQVKVLPEHADPMDIRYNVIQWVHRATRGWSYGSSVIDPRTGEIIKGHVTLGSLRVRQDILIAEALAAPFVRGDEVNLTLQNMALDRIRQLSAHEVGHTLGIAHNFSASVKDRASVMDYPHPLVSFNEDGRFNTEQAYAKGMGLWDTQVIKYGYADIAPDQEAAFLAQVLKENKQHGLEFISDSDARAKGGAHPTAHLWDNGAEPVTELKRILAVRQKALAQFGIKNIKNGTALSQLEEVLVPLYLLHRYQVEAAVKLIAGVDYQYEVRSEHAVMGNQIVSAAEQKAAFEALLSTVTASNLVIPESVLALITPKAYGESKTRESIKGRTGLTLDAMALPEVAAQHSLALLLHSDRLNRLQQQKMRDASQFGVRDLIFALAEQIFFADKEQAMAEKVQQRVQMLTAVLMAEQSINPAVAPEVQAELYSQLKYIAKKYQRSHGVFEQYLSDEIKLFLSTGAWSARFSPLVMPPGSPI